MTTIEYRPIFKGKEICLNYDKILTHKWDSQGHLLWCFVSYSWSEDFKKLLVLLLHQMHFCPGYLCSG